MKRAPRFVIAAVVFTAGSFTAIVAHAHFAMSQPTNWLVQNGSGDPQKNPPCGMQTGAVQTNMETTYKVGDKVTITINETVFHEGHYRVLIAQTQAALPNDPPVTPDARSECGSTPIAATPVLPLIADGLLVHTTPLAGPQTVQVSLPPGMTCEHCVLQVQEFMAPHGAPCFYHHCATISITRDGTPPPPATDAGVNGDAAIAGPGTTGGGCDAGIGGSSLAAGLVIGLCALRRRRR